MNRWMGKEILVEIYIYIYIYIYTHTHTREYYSATKKEWNQAMCSAEPRDHHNKWSKSERERKYHMISLIYRLLKNNTNELICRTETVSRM